MQTRFIWTSFAIFNELIKSSGMSKQKNLSHTKDTVLPDASPFSFGIVVAKWNDEITYSMRDACTKLLLQAGAKESNIRIIEVPGTFELPCGLRLLAQAGSYDAIICIGCVIKGETKHNDYISHSVASALSHYSVSCGVPAIFGVLTPDTWQQAKDRAGGKYGNKGDEAALTAIQMALLKKELTSTKQKIGFSK